MVVYYIPTACRQYINTTNYHPSRKVNMAFITYNKCTVQDCIGWDMSSFIYVECVYRGGLITFSNGVRSKYLGQDEICVGINSNNFKSLMTLLIHQLGLFSLPAFSRKLVRVLEERKKKGRRIKKRVPAQTHTSINCLMAESREEEKATI